MMYRTGMEALPRMKFIRRSRSDQTADLLWAATSRALGSGLCRTLGPAQGRQAWWVGQGRQYRIDQSRLGNAVSGTCVGFHGGAEWLDGPNGVWSAARPCRGHGGGHVRSCRQRYHFWAVGVTLSRIPEGQGVAHGTRRTQLARRCRQVPGRCALHAPANRHGADLSSGAAGAAGDDGRTGAVAGARSRWTSC